MAFFKGIVAATLISHPFLVMGIRSSDEVLQEVSLHMHDQEAGEPTDCSCEESTPTKDGFKTPMTFCKVTKGCNVCPDGWERVSYFYDCIVAKEKTVKWGSANWLPGLSPGRSEGHPGGCYFWLGQIYFNSDYMGKADSWSTLICKKPKEQGRSFFFLMSPTAPQCLGSTVKGIRMFRLRGQRSGCTGFTATDLGDGTIHLATTDGTGCLGQGRGDIDGAKAGIVRAVAECGTEGMDMLWRKSGDGYCHQVDKEWCLTRSNDVEEETEAMQQALDDREEADKEVKAKKEATEAQ